MGLNEAIEGMMPRGEGLVGLVSAGITKARCLVGKGTESERLEEGGQ